MIAHFPSLSPLRMRGLFLICFLMAVTVFEEGEDGFQKSSSNEQNHYLARTTIGGRGNAHIALEPIGKVTLG